MTIRKHTIPAWSGRWWWLESINVFCAVITLLAVIGSVQSIAENASSYEFFH